MGIEVVVGNPASVDFGATSEYSGVMLQVRLASSRTAAVHQHSLPVKVYWV